MMDVLIEKRIDAGRNLLNGFIAVSSTNPHYLAKEDFLLTSHINTIDNHDKLLPSEFEVGKSTSHFADVCDSSEFEPRSQNFRDCDE